MSSSVSGVEEMLKRMELLRKTVSGDANRKAVRAGAQVIAVAMKERAPTGPMPTLHSTALDLNELREDIKVRMHKQDDGDAQAWIGPGKKTGYVARFVEYGHRLVKGGASRFLGNGKTSGSGKEVAEVPAYPFLRPAFEESAEPARAAYVEEMKRQMGEVLK